MNRPLFKQNFMMLAKTSTHSCRIKINNIYDTINAICTGVHGLRASFLYPFMQSLELLFLRKRWFTDLGPLTAPFQVVC